MATNVDMGGDTLYVGDIVTGVTTPGSTTIGSIGATSGVDSGTVFQRFTLTGVNMNSAATDNAIAISLPQDSTTYKVNSVVVWGASGTLTTATAGLFTAVSGGGTGICADQALTPTSGTANTNLNSQALTLFANNVTTSFKATPLYFRVGTGQGVAATANVTVTIQVLG
jgi:hypothetical protein